MMLYLYKHLLQLILSPPDLVNLFQSFHNRIESFIDQGEDSDSVKVKKKMLVYYVYTTVVYTICLPFFNPYVTIKHAFLEAVFALCQLIMIKVKNYYIMVSYFILYTFLSIYLPVSKDNELLKGIGIALMHHNLFFLFPDNVSLKLIYIFVSQWLLRGTEVRVLTILKGHEMANMEAMIKSFYFTWPLIYIVNHVSSMYLVGAFQKAMHQNKKIENQFRDANKQLEETNQKLASTLNLLEKTNKELKEALKARELFIASASHELRNPLNAMIGNVELIRLESKDPRILKMVEACKVCGEVLLALINNILDVAKINADKLELHYLPGDFLEIVEKIWGISAFKMKEKGLKGELYVSHDFPKSIEMDSHRLMQILLNLIGNSAKFTTQGFVKVMVTWHRNESFSTLSNPHEDYLKLLQKAQQSARQGQGPRRSLRVFEEDPVEKESFFDLNQEINCRVLYPRFFSHILASNFSHLSTSNLKLRRIKTSSTINSEKKKGIIKIEIVDTGCGISEENVQNLFQPFCQADASISKRFGGTGLGLYITQQLIRKMGGEIHVYSQENIGSNFCILLPAIATPDEETSSEGLSDEEKGLRRPAGPIRRALVVDDDPFNRSIFTDYLRKLKVQADVAINGQNALDILAIKGFDYYSFITLDLDMPIMDGFTAAREIRRREAEKKVHKSLPIIVVTGTCTEIERIECLDPSGGVKATEFFRKPFSFADCKKCVHTVFRKQKVLAGEKMRVLVVDDNPFNTSFLQKYLVKSNFLCDACYNGKEALDMVSRCRYDVVLMDCEMPEMDGYTATRLIKQRYPRLLIVGITGHSEEEYLTKAKACGMNLVETKPINFEKLIGILEQEVVI